MAPTINLTFPLVMQGYIDTDTIEINNVSPSRRHLSSDRVCPSSSSSSSSVQPGWQSRTLIILIALPILAMTTYHTIININQEESLTDTPTNLAKAMLDVIHKQHLVSN
jgi:hypothetical protein